MRIIIEIDEQQYLDVLRKWAIDVGSHTREGLESALNVLHIAIRQAISHHDKINDKNEHGIFVVNDIFEIFLPHTSFTARGSAPRIIITERGKPSVVVIRDLRPGDRLLGTDGLGEGYVSGIRRLG